MLASRGVRAADDGRRASRPNNQPGPPWTSVRSRSSRDWSPSQPL
jgi:hypothetical protein